MKKSTLASKLKSKTPTDTAPHLIVQARAGTGKTTTIVEGLKVLRGIEPSIVPSPQQRAVWDSIALSKDHAKTVCFVAFNKSIATELQRRVPPGVDAMTMHSMGFAAIRNVYGKVAVSEHRVDDIVVKLLPQYADIWDLRRKRPGLIPLVKELVGLCKMNLLDGSEEDCYRLFDHHCMEAGDDSTILAEAVDLVPEVLRACADVDSDKAIDFDDMVWLPIKNNLGVKKYDLLLVDECQDLNRCQQALAKKAGHRLVLVGDDRQAIYGFAGADSESMKRMQKELSQVTYDFSADGDIGQPGTVKFDGAKGRGCVVLPLTVTRRCGRAIVEEARKIVPDFEAHESNGPGKVARNPLEGSNYGPGYRELAQDGDMVLCRLNAPLVSECFKFLKQGRRAGIQGRDIGQGLISTIKATKAESITDLVHGLAKWLNDAVAKENAKKHPSEDRIVALNDRYDCIMCFVDGQDSVAGVLAKIQAIFTDSKDNQGIRLSSIHRAKGLESDRVFILETEKTRLVAERAAKQGGWHYEQHLNLTYVAVTRAIKELVFVF